MNVNKINFSLLILMGTTWGLHFSLVKLLIDRGIDFMVILFLTLMGIFVVFAMTLAFRREKPRIIKKYIPFITISALLGYALPIGAELVVAAYIDATLLTLVVTSTPVFAIFVALVILRERISFAAALAAVIGIAAAAALLLPESALPASSDKYWLIGAFLVPLIYAIYNHYVARQWPEGLGLFQMAFWESLIAAMIALPFFIFALGSSSISLLTDNLGVVLLLALVTAVEVWAFFELVRRAGGLYVSFASFGALISGAVWGYLIFNDKITSWMILSFVMISASLILCSLSIPLPKFFNFKRNNS